MLIIGGKYKRRRLIAPKGSKTRPTASKVRETLFNICQTDIEGARFLDLFAGSGAMGLEALSRGASHATFVEQDKAALIAIKKNIATLNEEVHTTIWGMDVFRALEQCREKFDMIYCDPPYGKGLSEKILHLLDTHHILTPEGRLFLEDRAIENQTLHHLRLVKARPIGSTILQEYTLME